MNRESRESRHYKSTSLPTLRDDGIDATRRQTLLLKLYEQTTQTWRELLGIRFKLLALVPPVSLLAVAVVTSDKGWAEGLKSTMKMTVAGLGLVVTIGLLIYDIRNSALHDDLISRARKIEEELGVDTGIFLGRLNAVGAVRHSVATTLIYGASIVAWLFGIWYLL